MINFKQTLKQEQLIKIKVIKEEQYGPITEDAEKLSKGLSKLHQEKKGFYCEKIDNKVLKSLFFMSNRMKILLGKFSDVVFIDATHKSNRFNLPLLDGAIINNLGQTCSCFWSFISDHTYNSYFWAIYQLKRIGNILPKLFVIDEEEALYQGFFFIYNLLTPIAIKKVFPKSKIFFCSWHTSNNLKKHFMYLNKKKTDEAKTVYRKIINLPYCDYVDDYHAIYEETIKNKLLSEESISYLQKRNKYCDQWVKAFMNGHFTGGTCTTSRIEAKHRILKKFLNSELQKVFEVFAELESIEIKNYIVEFASFTKVEEEVFMKAYMLNHFSKIFCPYAMNKVKLNF